MLHAIPLAQSVVLGALDMLLKNMEVKENIGATTNYQYDNMKLEEQKIHQLVTVVEVFRKVAEAQIAFHRRRRNLRASRILQLPNEILSIILNYYHLGNPGHPSTVHTLRLICSQFYHATESTPAIWSFIRFRPGENWTRIQLEKSKIVPLSIDIKYLKQGQQNVAFSLIIPHMRRWRDVSISLSVEGWRLSDSSYVKSLNSMLQGLAEDEAPVIQEFTLANGFQSLPLNLFRGFAPRLRHLHIPSTTISWDNPILSGLTYLNIFACDEFQVPKAEQYVRILRSCPELEELHIRGRLEDCTSMEGSIFSLDLPLPRLRFLSLQSIHPSTVHSILSSIQDSPRYVNIIFPSLLADRGINVIDEAFGAPRDGSLLAKAYHSAPEVKLSHSNTQNPRIDAISKWRDGTPSYFYCHFGGIQSPILFMRPIFSTYSPTRTRTLVISEDVMVESELIHPRRLLEELSELEELWLSDAPGWPGVIMNLLSTPLEPLSNTQAHINWLCPNLKIFWIEAKAYDLSMVLAFVMGRFRHPTGNHPTKIESLGLSGHEEGEFMPFMEEHIQLASEIANIVGRDVFNWEERRLSTSNWWERHKDAIRARP